METFLKKIKFSKSKSEFVEDGTKKSAKSWIRATL